VQSGAEAPGVKRTCDNCGAKRPEKEQMYTLRLEMFARAEPLVISKEDLKIDHSAHLSKLVKKMEQMDPQEAEDQVYERYTFDLCSECRRTMHQQLKARKEAEGT